VHNRPTGRSASGLQSPDSAPTKKKKKKKKKKKNNVASCWIYIRILLGAHPIFYISRIRVNIRF
jgi:hypothetical protein